LIGNELRITD